MTDKVAGPDGSALSEGLGPLPEPAVQWLCDLPLLYGGCVAAATYYTAEQLRAYAMQERAAERERWATRCEALAAGEPHKWTAKTLRDLADEMRA